MINKARQYTLASAMTISCLFFGCNLFGATTIDSPAGGISVSVEKSATTPSNTMTMKQSKETVVDVISTNSDLSMLARAIKATGLESELQNGTFTIFAPDNAAFKKLPPGTLENLFKPENKDMLRDILLSHVVAKDLKTQDLKSGDLKAANGKDLKVMVSGSDITVNDAKVIKQEIVGSNGVIHVIDTVIIPQK